MAKKNNTSSTWHQRVFGCHIQSLSLFRINLSSLLLTELLLRFRYIHAFYSDEGTLPLRLLLPKIDSFYRTLCIHSYSGSISYQYLIFSVQVMAALGLLLGYKTRLCSILSWWLYLSLTLRNTWLAFILDRYFHYLLFYSMFLPLDAVNSIDAAKNGSKDVGIVVTPATVAVKLLVLWIYLDAGGGKFLDPNGGWTYAAQPLPALDAYTRHTVGARYVYALLGPFGLRLLTPIVVYVELGSAPLALFFSYLGWNTAVSVVIVTICMLHIGIAVTIRNTVLLSLVACCAWSVYYLPNNNENRNESVKAGYLVRILQSSVILSFIAGSVWFELYSDQCTQSQEHIWSTLLHNRWNVFTGAEEYVTWEIAPGRLADGSIVDVWSKSNTVSWDMPVSGTPCTSTSRVGRWRSFPYLADWDSQEEEDAVWGYLCRQWDMEHGYREDKKLLRFNFFMLQADVLPNMAFSETRKRLIQSFVCVDDTEREDSAEQEERVAVESDGEKERKEGYASSDL